MKTAEIAEKILPVYYFVQKKYGKDYSFAAQLTILYLLLKHRGYTKSIPTLNRYLRRLEDEGYIKRIRRTRRHPVHGLEFKSTICIILLKGYHQLRRLGLPVWGAIKHLIAKLKDKYPEFAVKSTKKMLSEDKHNPHHQENIRKILNQLGGNLKAEG